MCWATYILGDFLQRHSGHPGLHRPRGHGGLTFSQYRKMKGLVFIIITIHTGFAFLCTYKGNEKLIHCALPTDQTHMYLSKLKVFRKNTYPNETRYRTRP
jgi:hypothetical protein